MAAIAIVFGFGFNKWSKPSIVTRQKAAAPDTVQKIQAAILLDVSSSMEGLIEQAKAQLWSMVNTMGKATCEGQAPKIEIALYEYGRTDNPVAAGYVKKLSDFTTDLDSLSNILFELRTNGGDEFCGTVIKTSLEELRWSNNPNSYKVIFIAGNEDFLQGNIKYTAACALANSKNVIVNTIYCGDKMQGIREHWQLNGECGQGSYSNINQNARLDDIPTPYDSVLIALNNDYNSTIVGYGENFAGSISSVVVVDSKNEALSKKAQMNRIKTKGNKAVYKKSNDDLVALVQEQGVDALKKVAKEALPDSLRNKSAAEVTEFVTKLEQKRGKAQAAITALSKKREEYIATERLKNANATQEKILETEIEKIIKEQAKRFNMKID